MSFSVCLVFFLYFLHFPLDFILLVLVLSGGSSFVLEMGGYVIRPNCREKERSHGSLGHGYLMGGVLDRTVP